jgi:hypothetical protein
MLISKYVVLFFIGIGGLVTGLMVYVIARPLGSAYIHYYIIPVIAYFQFMPNIFGRLSQWAPDFLHVFSFSLISISLFSRSRVSRLFYCIFWSSANIILEIGQLYGEQLAGYIPAWFYKIPVLENTKDFFITGRFDIIDILAFTLGGIFAFLVSEIILAEKQISSIKKRGRHG